MNPNERQEYVYYRLEKAKESFKAAEILAENELWTSVINRLYYACFYAINAILFANEIEIKTHSGLKNQFLLHFIKTGKLDKKYGELFSDLFTVHNLKEGHCDILMTFSYDFWLLLCIFKSKNDIKNSRKSNQGQY